MAIPAAPSSVVLQTGNQKNLVSWNLVTGATTYQVQRSLDGVNFSNLGSAVAINSYVDSAVTVGTAYFYQVDAINVSGSSAFTTSYPPSIVPCLPGQINLGYLRYMSQLRADKLNSQYLTTDEWNWNINQSTAELSDILTNAYGEDYFLAPPLLIPLTGLDYYPLPDGSNYPINGINSPAIFKLTGIDANVGGASQGPNAGWIPLSRSNWSDRDKYTTFPGQAGALNNIYQMSYREVGQNLWIFPSNMNMSIRLLYIPILQQMLADTDMLPFSFTGWSEYVIIDAAMKGMIKEESLEKWNALDQSKAAIIERITVSASNRDVGQPNTVSNVRSTMGDPGFSNWGNGYGGGGFGGGGSGY
jgi:hypothetical protein